MILEERICFDNKNRADTFADWIKSNSCRVKTNEICKYRNEDVIRGRIDDIDS
jgi:hypothetical protein